MEGKLDAVKPSRRYIFSNQTIVENGVTVLHFIENASALRFFFIIESPDYNSIKETFGHCKTLVELGIKPVKKW